MSNDEMARRLTEKIMSTDAEYPAEFLKAVGKLLNELYLADDAEYRAKEDKAEFLFKSEGVASDD